MDILNTIILHKLHQVDANRKALSAYELEESVFFKRPCLSLSQALKAEGASGIIAEFKRKSPSKGDFNLDVSVGDVVNAYEKKGATGISILTDGKYFGGNGDDLVQAREVTNIPLLRKEFIVDEYQISEAKAMGADTILLIASILTPFEIERFSAIAESLGMETLLEVHNYQELNRTLKLSPHIHMVGVNNRNLSTFQVNLDTSLGLASDIPSQYVKVAESGIYAPQEVRMLREAGYQGFLIGGSFMEADSPIQAFTDFMEQLQAPSDQAFSNS